MTVKTISIILLTALLSYVALLFLPWWSNLVVAFIIVFIVPVKPGKAFVAGAAGTGLSWGLLSVIADAGNEHILSTKMAALFQLPYYWMVIIITILAGFITGGLGALAAGILRTGSNTDN